MIGDFKKFASDQGFTAAQVEALLKFDTETAKKLSPKMQAQAQQVQAERLEAMRTKDVETLKADKVFGGEKYQATVDASKSAMTQFFGEDGSALLRASGLDNHPAIVKGLARVRAAIGEDKGAAPPGTAPTPKAVPKSSIARGAGIYADPKVRQGRK